MRAIFLAVIMALTACPKSEPVASECLRAGDRCQLREGLLGICSERSDCETPPCLECRPQH